MTQFERVLVFYVLPIAVALVVAVLLHIVSKPLAAAFVPVGRLSHKHRTEEQQSIRREMIVQLLAGVISGTGFTIAAFVALAQFVAVDTLVWMIGLFGAGFGFSAKPFIADYMTGVAFITEDSFYVSDKVEILGIEGVVESVTLRMTTLRGTSGEVYTIPNGEIRTVRNFSRGRFTPVKVSVRVNATDLERALPFLEALGQEAPNHLPDLLEPWQVITEEARLGQYTELTLVGRAGFGKGAHTNPRLLAFVQNRLAGEGIAVAN